MQCAALALALVGMAACGGGKGQTASAECPASIRDEGADPASPGIVVLELAPEHYLPGNSFDLEGRTLRFSPRGDAYRVESLPLQWVSNFGSRVEGTPSARVDLSEFRFPFSGTDWSSLYVGSSGNITFGADQSAFFDVGRDRDLRLRTYGASMLNTVPIISALFRPFGDRDQFSDPRGVHRRHVHRQEDRVVITWIASAPYGNLGDLILCDEVNRFQVVLWQDGRIDLSYRDIAVADGVVGIFPVSTTNQSLYASDDPTDVQLPPHLDLLGIDVSLVDNHSLRFELRLRGEPLRDGDERLNELGYRVSVDVDAPFFAGVEPGEIDFAWIVGNLKLRYGAFGPGISPQFDIADRSVAFTVSLEALAGVRQFAVSVDATDFDEPGSSSDTLPPAVITLPDLPPVRTDLSMLSARDATRRAVYEAFHYPDVADERELACAVINQVGDRFDFMAFYTDFRIDRQGSGAPSFCNNVDTSRGHGGCVEDLSRSFCSDGRLQSGQMVTYAGAPLQARSGTQGGFSFDDYNMAVAGLSHEIAHRWSSARRALVDGETLSIGDGHWHFELHAPSAFPFTQPVEHSPMGASYWQDNGDGTFTRLGQPFGQAAGYSHLDLYLMGLLPPGEVPDFFLIESASFSTQDRFGNQVWTGVRRDLSVADVIAAHGPRTPGFTAAQNHFTAALIGIVEPGQAPSARMLRRLAGTQSALREYWSKATGEVSTLRIPITELTLVASTGE